MTAPTPQLLTIAQAADELGVPRRALRREAETHGVLIRFGRALRLRREDLGRLCELCQDHPGAPVSISDPTADGQSVTAKSSVERARRIAEKLKRTSPAISRREAAPVVQLPRTT